MEYLLKKALFILVSLVTLAGFLLGAEVDDSSVRAKVVQLAANFVEHNKLSVAGFETNEIAKYSNQFFTDGRPGYIANVKFKNGYSFTINSDGTNTAIGWFHDGTTKTYYALEDAPQEKITAVKALNLRNKLNSTNALELAKKFFKLQGHKEENFQSATLHQSYWAGGTNGHGGDLPYYEITWYRKDVKKADIESGLATLPIVVIEVSGIDSHLISYTKGFMPVGLDY